MSVTIILIRIFVQSGEGRGIFITMIDPACSPEFVDLTLAKERWNHYVDSFINEDGVFINGRERPVYLER